VILAHVALAADSLAAGAADLPVAQLNGVIERWHEFYLLAGTAAVTLVGLLFVALSFHLDTLLQAGKAHLLGSARMAFTSFLYVMMLSLAFLAPEIRPKFLALAMLMLSLFLLGHTVWVAWGHLRTADPLGHERFLRRRYGMTGFVAGVAAMSAVRFMGHPRAAWFYELGFIVAVMLVNAASLSWDLLVQVGRLKRAQEHGTGA
jgi:hypothetical protein